MAFKRWFLVHLRSMILTFFVTFAIPLTGVASVPYGVPVNPSESWFQKQTQFFHLVNVSIIEGLQKKEPSLTLRTKAGAIVSLNQLKEEIKTIQYRPSQWMKLEGAPADVSCQNSLGSQWITKYDSPNGRPLVFTSKNMNVGDFSVDDMRLAFHEAISAIGIVDDEYQVSAPLLILMMPKHGLRSELMQALQSIEWRKHSPRVKIDGQESCVKWKNSVGIPVQLAGGVTGVGGGGGSEGLKLKLQFLLWSKDWWNDQNKNGSPENWMLFFENLNRIGFEVANLRDKRVGVQGQFEMKKSKRTGQPSVYLYFDHDIDSQAESVVVSLYEHFDADKENSFGTCYDQAIWGTELAYEKGLLKIANLDKADILRIKKYLFSKRKAVSCGILK